MNKKTKLSLLISSILLAQGSYAADAETDATVDEADIERITVTTRQLEETIEKIPLSISVLNAEEISKKGISNTEDVSKYISSVSFDIGAAPNDTRPAIRGLTTERGRPNVAILVDGIDVSSESMTLAGGGMTANMRLLDLQQVEVVKGPQSVNYGRSAFAGAINYVTKKPSFEFGTKIDVNWDENETYEGSIRIEGGLTENFAASLKVSSWTTDGYYENPNTGGELGDGESAGAALGLYYVGNDWSAYFRGEYSDEEYGPRAVGVKHTLLPGGFQDLATNFMGTGVLAEGAEMLPYIPGTDCSMAMPYWDSFAGFLSQMGIPEGMYAACRPFYVGKVEGNESDIDQSPDPRTGKDFAGTDVENTRASLIVDWDISDDITFISSTGFTNNDTSVVEDFDLTNFSLISDPVGMPPFSPPFTQYGMQADSWTEYEVDQLSQEFKLIGGDDSLSWVVSALYWDESMDTAFNSQWWMREGVHVPTLLAMFQQNPFTSFITAANTGPHDDPRTTPMTRDTEHWSVAALIKYAITEDIHLTVEGRYIDETIDYTGQSDDRGFLTAHEIDFSMIYDPTIPPFGAMVENPNYNHKNSVSDDEFVPRFSLDWQVNDTVFTYASAAKGFKPGGISTTDGNGDVSTGEYKPETMWAYEIGTKAFSVENNAMVSLAAFYWDYTDQQVPFTITDPMTGMAGNSILNAGETSVTGVELESTWIINDNWTWSLGYLYSDAKYDDFNVAEVIAASDTGARLSTVDMALAGNIEGDYSDNRLPLSAEHSATTSIKYNTEIGELNLFGEVFGQYRSKRYVDAGNHAYLPEYDEWDVNIGLEGDNWSVIAYVENVFDDDKIKSALRNVNYGFFPDGQSVPSMISFNLPQPRTAGVRASISF
ncbi:TonB-dependent receptor [Thalassotalea sp. HSM 43]|uniref:TonB-dependent receptor n=1 Tax=Thalassotalea sp. HSM 43 TaxID=2552945 RepID=UPI001081B564|nr:TonB-dependent receptor [Thalassotalea sp. HSM 43]QBY04522.1 TonB-dependent receptor [Thalassotalea sp. HSM 43]